MKDANLTLIQTFPLPCQRDLGDLKKLVHTRKFH